jgi:Phage integrase family
VCGKPKEECQKPLGRSQGTAADHKFERDKILPEWHGWHAARRGLGTNMYRLGVPEKTIQAILRHANVSTTSTYYIKSAADDTRAAMAKLEKLLIGNEPHKVKLSQMATKWQQKQQTQTLLQSSKRLVYCRLNLVAAVGLEPTTYGL